MYMIRKEEKLNVTRSRKIGKKNGNKFSIAYTVLVEKSDIEIACKTLLWQYSK